MEQDDDRNENWRQNDCDDRGHKAMACLGLEWVAAARHGPEQEVREPDEEEGPDRAMQQEHSRDARWSAGLERVRIIRIKRPPALRATRLGEFFERIMTGFAAHGLKVVGDRIEDQAGQAAE